MHRHDAKSTQTQKHFAQMALVHEPVAGAAIAPAADAPALHLLPHGRQLRLQTDGGVCRLCHVGTGELVLLPQGLVNVTLRLSGAGFGFITYKGGRSWVEDYFAIAIYTSVQGSDDDAHKVIVHKSTGAREQWHDYWNRWRGCYVPVPFGTGREIKEIEAAHFTHTRAGLHFWHSLESCGQACNIQHAGKHGNTNKWIRQNVRSLEDSCMGAGLHHTTVSRSQLGVGVLGLEDRTRCLDRTAASTAGVIHILCRWATDTPQAGGLMSGNDQKAAALLTGFLERIGTQVWCVDGASERRCGDDDSRN